MKSSHIVSTIIHYLRGTIVSYPCSVYDRDSRYHTQFILYGQEVNITINNTSIKKQAISDPPYH